MRFVLVFSNSIGVRTGLNKYLAQAIKVLHLHIPLHSLSIQTKKENRNVLQIFVYTRSLKAGIGAVISWLLQFRVRMKKKAMPKTCLAGESMTRVGVLVISIPIRRLNTSILADVPA